LNLELINLLIAQAEISSAASGASSSAVSDAFGGLAPPIQIALFLGAMSFATAALVSLTAFTRIVIVLSFVRRALSTQEIPPNQVLLGLSIFLTLFVMAPTIETINEQGVQPYLAAQKMETPDKDISHVWNVAKVELHAFMRNHTRKNDLALFVELSETPTDISLEQVPLKVLIPAFIISELKTAFIMGFCIYIPFLLIDLVISTVLMSLGMMMMPPVVVSTPCKLLLFVLVDGWHLISRALVTSFGG
jgi:flagellar biosynthetic protein FliP